MLGSILRLPSFSGDCPKDISDRIKNKLRELKNEPFQFLEHYASGDVYKLRIGEYRARARIRLLVS